MSVPLSIRRAEEGDLAAVPGMLADDEVTQARGEAAAELDDAHRAAFAAIDADPHPFRAIAVEGEARVGCFQITVIPGLSRGAAWRGQIESVRVAGPARGRGVGARMMDWAIAECRRRGCAVVQLTSDKRGGDAHRFYARLGFEASHEGMKIKLQATTGRLGLWPSGNGCAVFATGAGNAATFNTIARYPRAMLVAVRILAILLVTLGFQIHGFAGAVNSATAGECAVLVAGDPDGEPLQAMPETPSPSCKLIGPGGTSALGAMSEAGRSMRAVVPEGGFAAVWPQGPEKPPKAV